MERLDIKAGFIYKLRKNFNSFKDVWLFIQIFLLLLILPLLLKFSSVPKIMKMFTPEKLKVYYNIKPEKLIERTVIYTDYILGHCFRTFNSPCLKRSLVLYYLLRKHGFDIQICLGVKYNEVLSDNEVEEKKLDGHAWLIYNGDIFMEKDPEITKTYKRTYCFPE